MGDWDSLQVPALAYEGNLYRVVCILVGHELNIKLVGNNEEKKLLFLYRIYAYIFISSPTLQSESVNRMSQT